METVIDQAAQRDDRHTNRAALPAAGLAIVLAMVLLVLVGGTTFTDVHLTTLFGYLCVWVPLLAAILVTAGRGGLAALRLSIRPIDLVWGLGVGLLARTGASLIEIAGYGSIGTTGASFGETVYDGWWLFGALVAPVLLAPVIEELFFRGLVLRAVYARVVMETSASRWAAPIAVGVSGLTFALMHLITIEPASTVVVVVVGCSTLLFGLGAAFVSLLTGRIGGAIIAHVTFNGLVIVPALLAA
ncbi:CPBP family intramembrane glutamic endopeptidase [Cryobacterium sp. Y11]|uniref:CPBP family intramembrane glutamic endopeptidase n=1 Tax=Cryobacterium sp. Y11 TaxID=2045016 RepID=UPI001304896C|nr:CPBP family intramembrane glutamic endopeptidase [Cryobacterium sp. Y11]